MGKRENAGYKILKAIFCWSLKVVILHQSVNSFQTTNFRLDQTQSVCRPSTILYLMKMAESSPNG